MVVNPNYIKYFFIAQKCLILNYNISLLIYENLMPFKKYFYKLICTCILNVV